MLTSRSFVPAESATLGLVDKSRVFIPDAGKRLTTISFYSCSNTRICLQGPPRRLPRRVHLTCLPLPQEQSAFMIDLNQVSFALRNCTERSLIILDEFGKGTLSTGSSSLVRSPVTLPVVS